jgi:hypothetical protein
LSATKKDVTAPAIIPLSIEDDPQRTSHADIVESATSGISFHVGGDVAEAHTARAHAPSASIANHLVSRHNYLWGHFPSSPQ